MKQVVSSLFTAFILWAIMFLPFTAPHVNFWLMMTISALVLTTCTIFFNKEEYARIHVSLKQILLGIAIAAVLWCVFWVGDKVSQWMFDFARMQVNQIYGLKSDSQSWLIALLLLFIIGPAEELFWRGFIQERLSQKYNKNIGFLLTLACYTLVHIASGNFMLIMAALACGGAWGLLYRFIPQHFAAIIISHAVWDAVVFVILPI